MKTAFVSELLEQIETMRERLGERGRMVVSVTSVCNGPVRYNIVSRKGGMSLDDITLLREILNDEMPTTESDRLLLSYLPVMCEAVSLNTYFKRGLFVNLCTVQELHEITVLADASQNQFTVESIYFCDL